MNIEAWFQRACALTPVAEARRQLATLLPSGLYYHAASHTDDVIREVILLGLTDSLPERSIELLTVAAAFHDTGFIVAGKENETYGAERARSYLSSQDIYSASEIETIYQIILDTKLQFLHDGPRQVPRSLLAQYLCDADVGNLGRHDFFEKAELYRKELAKEKKEFYKGFTLAFMQAQRWHTPAAQKLRGPTKEENLNKLILLARDL